MGEITLEIADYTNNGQDVSLEEVNLTTCHQLCHSVGDVIITSVGVSATRLFTACQTSYGVTSTTTALHTKATVTYGLSQEMHDDSKCV